MPPKGDLYTSTPVQTRVFDRHMNGESKRKIAREEGIDRGTVSRGVLDQLIALAGRCRLVPLLGNREEMLIASLRDRSVLKVGQSSDDD